MAFDRLIKKIIEMKNPTVVGLDPKLSYIPDYITKYCFDKYGETLEGAAEAFLEFNKCIIDEICDIVPAIKPQCAYYEALGWQGMRVLEETISYAKSCGMFVITDGKRNDIGSTMEMYAVAHLGKNKIENNEYEPFGADALTVNGYLGTDTIAPLAQICKDEDKGMFVLVKTSNKSSGELQDRILDSGEEIYKAMGKMCENWGEESRGEFGYSAVGAVVGATYPTQLSEMRAEMPHTFILVPGYGAQGGTAKDVAGAFDNRGLGAIINSSRGILTAWQKKGMDEMDFAKGAREAAIEMREDITSVIGEIK
ncbi:MAG: orotidine-5'-phosphate decarboxylase [Oscillospiraceae bacterium]